MKRYVYVMCVETSKSYYQASVYALDETEALNLFASVFNPILASRVKTDGKMFIHESATATCILTASAVIDSTRMSLDMYAKFKKIGG